MQPQLALQRSARDYCVVLKHLLAETTEDDLWVTWASGIKELPCSEPAGGDHGAAPLLWQQRPRSWSAPASLKSNCIEYMKITT